MWNIKALWGSKHAEPRHGSEQEEGEGWETRGDEVRKVGLDHIQEGGQNLRGKPGPEAAAKGGPRRPGWVGGVRS